ncbi:MAG: ATP-binding protein [Verrucomicrobiota bacterium]|nr:ATP-binding protein [Verrucomicrobiota bacterium]
MFRAGPKPNPELWSAFLKHEQEVAIQRYRVACILGVIFMPAGVTLDFFVYPGHVGRFFALRVICSLLLFALWWLFGTEWGKKRYRGLGLVEVSLPLFCISWMIFEQDGAVSPYYAGLNLVLMGSGLILRWTIMDSIYVFIIAMLMYLAAVFAHGPIKDGGIFFNNLYFLLVTAVFVIVGNAVYNRQLFREFELRYELDRSRRTVEESHQKLVELDQVKSRFFANISHELRTPLTLLLAPLESLQQQLKEHYDPEIPELLRTMHANGMRLLKLINDLLDLVRLESGKMNIREDAIDLKAFLLGLVQSIRQVAADKRIQVSTHVDAELDSVLTDRDKLEKITLNLLFNAVKFTPAGGEIAVSAEREGNVWFLKVKDTGVGISEEQIKNVFSRFWQADTSSQRKYQGVGIGLALVKELAEIQGGKVSVESQINKGTTMSIQLPFKKPNAGAPQVETAPASLPEASNAVEAAREEWLTTLYRRAELFPAMTMVQDSMRPIEFLQGGNKPVVLIADDEPDMLRFLKSQLQRQWQVLEAVDGNQAIEKASQFLPDAILLDMMMPEKDGLEVCRELRQRTPTQRIPIILLTARADEETKLTALEVGANDFLTKPFSTTELHVRINNLIEARHFERRLARQNQILEATLQQLKDTETQLVQSEKLASLGRMSAGIIHEINNPLNFAKTAIYMLRNHGKALPEDDQGDYLDVVKDIEEGINRVRTIVSDLRAFTHPNTENFHETKLEPCIAAALRFLSHDWKEQVEIQNEVSHAVSFYGNEHQIIQVVLNLLQNSLDAMKGKQYGDQKPTIHLSVDEIGDRLILKIRDNGPGIPPEVLPKIFDPFFTTKDVGEGMGLGLSICYKIMQSHQGRISVESELGSFTEFSLEFPVRRSKEAALSAA